MTTFLTALGDLIGLTETHETEYDGAAYATPSLIENDDGKEAGWTSTGEKESCR